MEDKDLPCFTDDMISEYVGLANQFTQDLSASLIAPMWILFVAFAGLWIAIQGLRLSLFQITVMDIMKDLMFVILAAILLSGQGPGLVNTIYTASLDMMGSAASVALEVGNRGGEAAAPVNGAIPLDEGMRALTCTAENGVTDVFGMAGRIFEEASVTSPMPYLYGLVLVIPYFLVLIVYFSQVVVSIFRIMMLAALSPFLMLGFGFGWGRGMMQSGVKTLLSSFMVLFGATAALAFMLYGVEKLDIASLAKEDIDKLVSLQNPQFLLAVALGWLGTAFMTEATGIANSISGSVLSNTSAGIITAGATATAMMLANNPVTGAALKSARSVAGAAGWGAAGTLLNPGGAPGAAAVRAQEIARRAAELTRRAKNFGRLE